MQASRITTVRRMFRKTGFLITLSLPVLFAACTVAPPSGPTLMALPPQGKDLQQFQGEDYRCRDYAQSTLGNPAAANQRATSAAVGSAAAGTALGAATGALIGAAGAAAGAGAAVGAGFGLLAGSMIGANQAGGAAYGMQDRYNLAYAQCMTSAGNSVQAPPPRVVGYPYAYPYYPYGWYGPYGGYGWRGW